jgi:prolyl oligopeptidase
MMVRINRIGYLLLILMPLFQLISLPLLSAQTVVYPGTRTTSDYDIYFGNKVSDPYRWLEDINSPEVQAWVAEETKLTRSYLDSIPFKEYVKDRLYKLRRCSCYAVPERRGGRYFYFKNDEGMYYSKYYLKESLDSKPRLLLDFDEPPFSNDQVPTCAVPSPDGKLLAYVVSERGVKFSKLLFLNIDTGQCLPDTLKCHSNIDLVWASDNSGCYYTEWTGIQEELEIQSTQDEKVYWHRLGTPFADDKVLFQDKSDTKAQLWLESSSDSRIVVLHKQNSKNFKFYTYYLNPHTDTAFTRLFSSDTERFALLDNIGSTLYFSTAFKYPGAKIISYDLNGKKSIPKELYAPQDIVIRFTAMADSHLVVVYLEDGYSHIKILDLTGKFIRNLDLPVPGTIGDVYADRFDTLLFMKFESYLYPNTAYYYNLKSDSIAVFSPTGAAFDFNAYKTKQYYFESSGGIEIPLLLTFRKDQVIDGNNPTLLYGYGAYGKSLIPEYSPSILLWLENGGTYAVANIRGGGEFGDLWHRAGSGPNKQSGIDDFINAARWLIDKKITKPSKLAIMGESAGGLLVTACMNQQPGLFGAAVAGAPPADMLRYPRFTAKGSQNEWGDATEDKFQYQVLRAYSPYHNVDPKAKYPPALVLTGGNDNTVPPLHAFKYIAALQAIDDGTRPKLLRFEKYSTHQSMGSLELFIRKDADIYTFLFKTLGVEVQTVP